MNVVWCGYSQKTPKGVSRLSCVFSQPSGCGSEDGFEDGSENCRYGTRNNPNRHPTTTNIPLRVTILWLETSFKKLELLCYRLAVSGIIPSITF
ncbi:MAG: hypothetical protein LBG58_15750 [Planctomycetaceae bacterium]|nr:hypothetical protein [Planctomycetaceae bacterium]